MVINIFNNSLRNCKNYFFPPTGGKKLNVFTEKFAKTDFLQDRHKWIFSENTIYSIFIVVKKTHFFHVKAEKTGLLAGFILSDLQGFGNSL